MVESTQHTSGCSPTVLAALITAMGAVLVAWISKPSEDTKKDAGTASLAMQTGTPAPTIRNEPTKPGSPAPSGESQSATAKASEASMAALAAASYAAKAEAAAKLATRGQEGGPDRRVTIKNRSGQSIYFLIATRDSLTDWDDKDWLGEGRVLSDGDSIRINFDDDSGECVFDFRARLQDDSYIERSNVDVCRATELVFSP